MIDIDKLFENYFRKFIAENVGKYSEEELEDKVSELYEEFGETSLKELDGKSPKQYFEEMSAEELCNALKSNVIGGVAISDFLCDAIEKKDGVDEILIKNVLDYENDELAVYSVNILNFRGNTAVLPNYVLMIKSDKISEPLKELMTEILSDNADKVKEEVISNYGDNESADKYYIEILSSMKHDDRVFDILISEFLKHKNELSLYTSYLLKYGDEKALPYLEKMLLEEDVKGEDLKEIELAIESFGG